jgi:hypothetical protein
MLYYSVEANNIVIDCRIPDDSDDSEEEDNEESDVKSSENDGKSADLGATSDTATGGKSVTG